MSAIDFDAETTAFSSSDKLKIFLRHPADVYVYLLLHDAEGEIHILHPVSSESGLRGADEVSVYIPEGLPWFNLTGTGIERFYLLCSVQRQADLEADMYTIDRAAGLRKDGYEKAEAQGRLLERIRRLQMENYEIVKKSGQTVVLIAGEVRGIEESLEFPACRTDFEGFHFRTVRISH